MVTSENFTKDLLRYGKILVDIERENNRLYTRYRLIQYRKRAYKHFMANGIVMYCIDVTDVKD